MKKIILSAILAIGLVGVANADMKIGNGYGVLNDKGVAYLEFGYEDTFADTNYVINAQVASDGQANLEANAAVFDIGEWEFSTLSLTAGAGAEVFKKIGTGESCSGALIQGLDDKMVCTDMLIDNEDSKELNTYAKFGIESVTMLSPRHVLYANSYVKFGNEANAFGTNLSIPIDKGLSLTLNAEYKLVNDTENDKFKSNSKTILVGANYRF